MFDMLQLVVRFVRFNSVGEIRSMGTIEAMAAQQKLGTPVCTAYAVTNLDDKLKHIGHHDS